MAGEFEADLRDPGLSWAQLRAFEACVRLSSFGAAAAALGLTPAAVRHQVGLLEGRLGARLFERQGGRLALTPVGAAFARQIERPMRDLVRACAAAGKAAASAPLTLTAPPLFARQYLFEPRFLKWCDVSGVRLDVTDTRRDLFSPEPIAGVRLDAEPDPELTLTPLIRVEVGLAAAPAIAATARPTDPAWWADQILLTPSSSRNAWPLVWAALGLTDVVADQRPAFSSYAAALEAACAGRGVILAPLAFAAGEFASGRLARIGEVRLPGREGYALAMRRTLAATPKGRALRRRVMAAVAG